MSKKSIVYKITDKINKKNLKQKYLIENLTINECAIFFQKSKRTITRNLKKFDLKKIPEGGMYHELRDKKWLNKKYIIEKKSSIKMRDKLEKLMDRYKIEYRRGNAGGGNQLRQPYLKKYIKKINFKNYKNVDHIHFFGYYIGNYPSLNFKKIKQICKILNIV